MRRMRGWLSRKRKSLLTNAYFFSLFAFVVESQHKSGRIAGTPIPSHLFFPRMVRPRERVLRHIGYQWSMLQNTTYRCLGSI